MFCLCATMRHFALFIATRCASSIFGSDTNESSLTQGHFRGPRNTTTQQDFLPLKEEATADNGEEGELVSGEEGGERGREGESYAR